MASAGSGAARPTSVHSEPSIEYAPVTFVPSEESRTQYWRGKSAGRFAVESAVSLRGCPLFSQMNSNFSSPLPAALVARRPNFVKF